ncbi:hypothetical protein E2562_018428 [Oryza meyeriana var. granulata]|uniref:Rx N-terminal domain-containing protein n=1 Tax=Oryza meyeriana var. granulata TaxID=110450 RepID=A0A6G1EMB5_9ORYZ|nr:hypothetical protein E2562_018428 [Oryza meyeriana var. granulata]
MEGMEEWLMVVIEALVAKVDGVDTIGKQLAQINLQLESQGKRLDMWINMLRIYYMNWLLLGRTFKQHIPSPVFSSLPTPLELDVVELEPTDILDHRMVKKGNSAIV